MKVQGEKERWPRGAVGGEGVVSWGFDGKNEGGCGRVLYRRGRKEGDRDKRGRTIIYLLHDRADLVSGFAVRDDDACGAGVEGRRDGDFVALGDAHDDGRVAFGVVLGGVDGA